jgi:ABC-type iron transport system FetAB permease component
MSRDRSNAMSIILEYRKEIFVFLVVLMMTVLMVSAIRLRRSPKKLVFLIFLSIPAGALIAIGFLVVFSMKYFPYLAISGSVVCIVSAILTWNERKRRMRK